jgi:hypothetical protein
MDIGSVLLKARVAELKRPAVLYDGANDVIWDARRDRGVDLEGHCDVGTDQSGKVSQDLVRDATCVAAGPGRVKRHASVIPLRRHRARLGAFAPDRVGRPSHVCRGCRLRPDIAANHPAQIHGWPLLLELAERHIGLDEQIRQIVLGDRHMLARSQASVPASVLVVAVRVCERLLVLEEQAKALSHRLDEDRRSRQPGR